MERRYTPLDAVRIRWQTARARQTARIHQERVVAFQADLDREERKKAHCCLTCWYFHRGRIGGAAMTRWHCGICANPQMASSTATDEVCLECAKEHELCTQCGGDVRMRERRRTFPTPAPVPPKDAEGDDA